MKVIIYFVLLIFLSCGTAKINNSSDADTIIIKNEELEYEIIIIEPGFNDWLATQQPMSYYTQNVLETKNNMFVLEWNRRFLNPLKSRPPRVSYVQR